MSDYSVNDEAEKFCVTFGLTDNDNIPFRDDFDKAVEFLTGAYAAGKAEGEARLVAATSEVYDAAHAAGDRAGYERGVKEAHAAAQANVSCYSYDTLDAILSLLANPKEPTNGKQD